MLSDVVLGQRLVNVALELVSNRRSDRKEKFRRILLAFYVRLSRESYRGVENSSAPSSERIRIALGLLLSN